MKLDSGWWALGWAIWSVGCGGSAPPSAHGAEDEAVDAEAAEATAPSDPDAMHATVLEAGERACDEACEHLASCTVDDGDCAANCRRELAVESGAPALQYAGCVQSFTCDRLRDRAGVGPAGSCFMQAARMAR